MTKTGIWMDSKNAHIVRLVDSEETFETIASSIEFFNRTGTGGTRVKTGATQDVTHEKTYLEREKKQFKEYFKKIAEAVSGTDELALFGPADTNEKFKKEVAEHYKPLAAKISVVEKVDRMTENQIKALVREYFGRS